MNKEQKQSIQDFVEGLFDRQDIDFEARVDAVLGYVNSTISKMLGRKQDNYVPSLSKLQEAEYGCELMKKKLAPTTLDHLQKKLNDGIAKIVIEKQKIYALWESPGTCKVIPEIAKAVAEEGYELAATHDENRKARANFLTTAQFGQSLPEWPAEGSTVPDREYKQ